MSEARPEERNQVPRPTRAEASQRRISADAAPRPLGADAARGPGSAEAARRPLRADAARNVQLLVAAARDAFALHGAEASLDDIAKRAGVGPGTLYRHFPSRGKLAEAVYRDGVRTLCDTGEMLLETEPPGDALMDWLRAFARYAAEKKGLGKSLLDTIDNRDELFRELHLMINATAIALLDRAKAAGEIRADLEVSDLIRLASAVGSAAEQSPEGSILSDRLLSLSLDGLRRR
jgi:AcrR family transcriptional regulator